MFDWSKNQQIQLAQKKRKDEAMRKMAVVKSRRTKYKRQLEVTDTQNDKDDKDIEMGYLGQDVETQSYRMSVSRNSYQPMVKAADLGISDDSIEDDSLDNSRANVLEND